MEDKPQDPGQKPPQTPTPEAPPPPTPSSPPSTGVSPNRTIMLILSYLGILALIPLLVETNDQEVQWHAKHGIVLIVAWIVVWIALFIIGFVPVIGSVLGCAITPLLAIAILVIHIVCIVKAVNGEQFRLPFVSDFADQWK